jgi:hypothetical protein
VADYLNKMNAKHAEELNQKVTELEQMEVAEVEAVRHL